MKAQISPYPSPRPHLFRSASPHGHTRKKKPSKNLALRRLRPIPMEATAVPRALFLFGTSPAPSHMRMNCLRVAIGGDVRRQGAVAVWAKKKRGRGRDSETEERVDTHSFTPKPGEAAGLFPEAVLLRKVRSFFCNFVHPFPDRLPLGASI
jgi:hypothetical protein